MGPIQTPGMFPRRNQAFSAATNLVSEFGKLLRDALVLQGDHVTMPLPTCITDYNKKDQETRAGDSRSLQQTLPSVCESICCQGRAYSQAMPPLHLEGRRNPEKNRFYTGTLVFLGTHQILWGNIRTQVLRLLSQGNKRTHCHFHVDVTAHAFYL